MTDPIDRPYFPANEPDAQQEGVDAPGFFSATSDFMNGGIYNGTFRIGPPQSASNIDVASSVVGSNFVPGWRFVQSSNTAITGLHLRNTAAPSGSNFRFVYASGAATDEAFIEQLIDVTGSAVSSDDAYRATVLPTGANFDAAVRVQYLMADGTITGGEGEAVYSLVAGTKKSIVLRSSLPTNAKYARLRVLTDRGAAATSATGTVDVLEVKRDRPATQVALSDVNDPDANDPSNIYQYDGDLVVIPSTAGKQIVHVGGTSYPAPTTHSTASGGDWIVPSSSFVNVHGFYDNAQAEKYTFTNSTGGSNLLLGWSIMPIVLSRSNIAATTTVRLNFPTEAGGPQYFPIPFPTHLVGVTVAIQGTITAGTIVVDVMTGPASTVLVNDICTFTTTSATAFSFNYALGTYQYAANVSPGIQIVATGLAPTTIDVSAVLFLATPMTGGL